MQTFSSFPKKRQKEVHKQLRFYCLPSDCASCSKMELQFGVLQYNNFSACHKQITQLRKFNLTSKSRNLGDVVFQGQQNKLRKGAKRPSKVWKGRRAFLFLRRKTISSHETLELEILWCIVKWKDEQQTNKTTHM